MIISHSVLKYDVYRLMSYYVLFSKNQWNPHTKFLAICDTIERAKDLWYQWREDDDDITRLYHLQIHAQRD